MVVAVMIIVVAVEAGLVNADDVLMLLCVWLKC